MSVLWYANIGSALQLVFVERARMCSRLLSTTARVESFPQNRGDLVISCRTAVLCLLAVMILQERMAEVPLG